MEIKLFLNIIKFFNLAILFAKLLRLRINETLLYFYTYVEEIMIETRLEIDLEISADVHRKCIKHIMLYSEKSM